MCLAHVTIVYIILGMNFKYFEGILGVAVDLYVIWLDVVHIFRYQPKGKGVSKCLRLITGGFCWSRNQKFLFYPVKELQFDNIFYSKTFRKLKNFGNIFTWLFSAWKGKTLSTKFKKFKNTFFHKFEPENCWRSIYDKRVYIFF